MSNPARTQDEPLDRSPELARLIAATRERWRAADPLLPHPAPFREDESLITVTGENGGVAGAATYQRIQPVPDSLDLTWGEADQHRLRAVRLADGEPAALGALLVAWRQRLSALHDRPGRDSAAAVTLPSRDTAGVSALLDHGLHPLAVIAARPAGRTRPAAARAEPGLSVRLAGRADVDAVVALHLQEVRYDAQFGSVQERPQTRSRLRESLGGVLDEPEPWVWLAERDGRQVGMVAVSPPGRAAWVASLAAPDPVAYLDCLSVSAGARGAGVGSALVERAHRRLDAAGVAVTLLHYGLANPLSGPFWSRMGYRPLWTNWKARPATALR